MLIVVNFPALVDGTFYGKNLERPENDPAYWTQARSTSTRGDHQTRVLEEPGTDFAAYTWGNTVDPITPGLMDRPYVARELIPYGTPGTADLLNALDRRFQEGVADPAGARRARGGWASATSCCATTSSTSATTSCGREDLAPVLAATPGLGAADRVRPAVAVPAAGGLQRRDRASRRRRTPSPSRRSWCTR